MDHTLPHGLIVSSSSRLKYSNPPGRDMCWPLFWMRFTCGPGMNFEIIAKVIEKISKIHINYFQMIAPQTSINTGSNVTIRHNRISCLPTNQVDSLAQHAPLSGHWSSYQKRDRAHKLTNQHKLRERSVGYLGSPCLSEGVCLLIISTDI